MLDCQNIAEGTGLSPGNMNLVLWMCPQLMMMTIECQVEGEGLVRKIRAENQALKSPFFFI